jgi:uncharacterized membrane protein HdeD (DUF308 family)
MKKHVNWGELIAGIVMIILGIFTLASPGSMLTGVVILYGIFAIVMGIMDFVIYLRMSRFTGFGPVLSLISGIFSVMCGVMLLANPNIGKLALTILLPLWFISHCISKLIRLDFMQRICSPGYYHFTLSVNIIGLILGMIMLLSPSLSFMTIRIVCCIAGIYFILLGIESIIAAFAGRSFDW